MMMLNSFALSATHAHDISTHNYLGFKCILKTRNVVFPSLSQYNNHRFFIAQSAFAIHSSPCQTKRFIIQTAVPIIRFPPAPIREIIHTQTTFAVPQTIITNKFLVTVFSSGCGCCCWYLHLFRYIIICIWHHHIVSMLVRATTMHRNGT